MLLKVLEGIFEFKSGNVFFLSWEWSLCLSPIGQREDGLRVSAVH